MIIQINLHAFEESDEESFLFNWDDRLQEIWYNAKYKSGPDKPLYEKHMKEFSHLILRLTPFGVVDLFLRFVPGYTVLVYKDNEFLSDRQEFNKMPVLFLSDKPWYESEEYSNYEIRIINGKDLKEKVNLNICFTPLPILKGKSYTYLIDPCKINYGVWSTVINSGNYLIGRLIWGKTTLYADRWSIGQVMFSTGTNDYPINQDLYLSSPLALQCRKKWINKDEKLKDQPSTTSAPLSLSADEVKKKQTDPKILVSDSDSDSETDEAKLFRQTRAMNSTGNLSSSSSIFINCDPPPPPMTIKLGPDPPVTFVDVPRTDSATSDDPKDEEEEQRVPPTTSVEDDEDVNPIARAWQRFKTIDQNQHLVTKTYFPTTYPSSQDMDLSVSSSASVWSLIRVDGEPDEIFVQSLAENAGIKDKVLKQDSNCFILRATRSQLEIVLQNLNEKGFYGMYLRNISMDAVPDKKPTVISEGVVSHVPGLLDFLAKNSSKWRVAISQKTSLQPTGDYGFPGAADKELYPWTQTLLDHIKSMETMHDVLIVLKYIADRIGSSTDLQSFPHIPGTYAKTGCVAAFVFLTSGVFGFADNNFDCVFPADTPANLITETSIRLVVSLLHPELTNLDLPKIIRFFLEGPLGVIPDKCKDYPYLFTTVKILLIATQLHYIGGYMNFSLPSAKLDCTTIFNIARALTSVTHTLGFKSSDWVSLYKSLPNRNKVTDLISVGMIYNPPAESGLSSDSYVMMTRITDLPGSPGNLRFVSTNSMSTALRLLEEEGYRIDQIQEDIMKGTILTYGLPETSSYLKAVPKNDINPIWHIFSPLETVNAVRFATTIEDLDPILSACAVDPTLVADQLRIFNPIFNASALQLFIQQAPHIKSVKSFFDLIKEKQINFLSEDSDKEKIKSAVSMEKDLLKMKKRSKSSVSRAEVANELHSYICLPKAGIEIMYMMLQVDPTRGLSTTIQVMKSKWYGCRFYQDGLFAIMGASFFAFINCGATDGDKDSKPFEPFEVIRKKAIDLHKSGELIALKMLKPKKSNHKRERKIDAVLKKIKKSLKEAEGVDPISDSSSSKSSN